MRPRNQLLRIQGIAQGERVCADVAGDDGGFGAAMDELRCGGLEGRGLRRLRIGMRLWVCLRSWGRWAADYRRGRSQPRLLLLMPEQEVAMLVELFPQGVARGLEDALLDAWPEVARIVSQVGAAVELQKAVLAIEAMRTCWCCCCHFQRGGLRDWTRL